MPVLPGIIKAVLEAEDSPTRFERFCLDICSKTQGIRLIPTSLTRDLGRNGRSMSSAHILCATLEKEIEKKIEKDINRLKETTATDSIIYCCSKALTEEKCDEIAARIRKNNPQFRSVLVLGQVQLIALAEKEEQVIRRYYDGEIKNVEQALLLQPSAKREADEIGLRLALVVQGGDDSSALRKELAAQLILETIHERGPMNALQLAGFITAQLHLPRPVSAGYMSSLLDEMKNANFIFYKDGTADLSVDGIKRATDVPGQAGTRLLEGRLAVRNEIKILSGHNIVGTQFEQFWDAFQDGIAELFYSHGLSIVQMVRSILQEETSGRKVVLPIEKLANRVAFLFEEPTQKEEIRQAIIDVFSEKDSEAFQWLAQICGMYVMLCSLGFETLSNQQVRNILLDFALVPDSDVVLSLLCEGEPNHDLVLRIMTDWRALGGKILSSRPVLEEVAYHAWISEKDYCAFEADLDRLSDNQAMHLIENTFVRAFRKVAGSTTARKYWNQYIMSFRGGRERDYSKILDILRNDYGFVQLSADPEKYESLREKIKDFLIQRICEESKHDVQRLDFRTKDKAMRDGELFAAVHAERESMRAISKPPNVCIISSSRMLKEADEVFREELGSPDAVLSIAAMSFLLTLCPQVAMGLSNLRSVLFDLGLAARMKPVQRYAYRVIASSSKWEVPWSKRSTLARELSQVLLSEAQARGKPVELIKERVLESKDSELSAKVVAEALSKMAISSIPQNEVLKLRAQVDALQRELAVRDRTNLIKRQGKEKPKRDRKRRIRK